MSGWISVNSDGSEAMPHRGAYEERMLINDEATRASNPQANTADDAIKSYVIDHISQAIDQGWIRPHYQAIVRASTGDLCGEEALARWIDPVHGMLGPDRFVPALEEAGLLHLLDMHIVDCVLADMKTKRENDVAIVPVSVNLSRRDMEEVDIAYEIAKRADAAGVSRSLLRIEFTESAALDDPEAFEAQIAALHEAGFEVWMDDFGSGYSSLGMLERFGFDLIKLDMGFVRHYAGNKAQDIIAGVVQIAGKLGIATLAEGVELEEQALFLEDVGVGMLQGYFYSRSLPLEVMMDHFQNGRGIRRENIEETAYWDAVGRVDLRALSADDGKWNSDEMVVSQFPAGVLEHRGDTWRVLRANASYRKFLEGVGILSGGLSALHANTIGVELDDEFIEASNACLSFDGWMQVASRLEYGTGLHYRVKHIAATADADAFVIASTPTTFGKGLGAYGDVPLAYAVFRVVLDDAGEEAVDAEYVYANPLYCEWGGLDQKTLVGRRFLEVYEHASTAWFPYCYRAAILGESVHDVEYSPETEHWLSFYIEPSPVKNCCVYAFAIVDDERHERDEIIADREGADFIIETINTLSRESDHDAAIRGALEMTARLVRPTRISVFEIEGTRLPVTYEWCASGVEPQIDKWQSSDVELAGPWMRLLEQSGTVVVPNVHTSDFIPEDQREWFLSQGITSCLSVPIYCSGRFAGYLGVDNYTVHEGVNTNRLLGTVAAFLGSRISARKLVEQLEALKVE